MPQLMNVAALFPKPAPKPRESDELAQAIAAATDRDLHNVDMWLTALRECACRVINSGRFDDALWGEILDEYKAQEFDRFIAAVRTEVIERANESIYTAREFNREALEDR